MLFLQFYIVNVTITKIQKNVEEDQNFSDVAKHFLKMTFLVEWGPGRRWWDDLVEGMDPVFLLSQFYLSCHLLEVEQSLKKWVEDFLLTYFFTEWNEIQLDFHFTLNNTLVREQSLGHFRNSESGVLTASVFERTLNSPEYKVKALNPENIMVETQNVSFTAPDLQQLANIALEAMLIFPPPTQH